MYYIAIIDNETSLFARYTQSIDDVCNHLVKNWKLIGWSNDIITAREMVYQLRNSNEIK